MVYPLDPCSIPKYVNQLLKPPVFRPKIKTNPNTGEQVSYNYKVAATEFMQQILPNGFPKTKVWGYEGIVTDPDTCKPVCFHSSPGPTFEVKRDVPANVQWVNDLTNPSFLPVDPTLHWANPSNIPTPIPPFPKFPPGFPLAQSPVPIVTHLHGAEVRADSDGGPEAWFTPGEVQTGPNFTRSDTHYPNEQEPATLWYHDHTLGTTRLNVYAGLAGFYLIKDPKNPIEHLLPKGEYEIPIVIQDRSFTDDGSLAFPNVGDNPNIHPYWVPAFAGNTIMVNGRVWPNLNVERRQYRFRILNGSNFRHYNLRLTKKQYFIQIGSDGGFLPKPVRLKELLIAPGERADVLIDFSKLEPCTKIIMKNNADAPYPVGETPNPRTIGQIMRFSVVDSTVVPPSKLPCRLNKIPKFFPDVPKKILTLNVVPGPNGTRELLLNGQTFVDPVSETPVVGSTVIWDIVSLTANSHPIHVHLIQFKVKNRQYLDRDRYQKEWIKLNGEPPLDHPTIELPIEPFLIGAPIKPPPNERGWKDTVLSLPNQVTRLSLRFAPQDAKPSEVNPGVNLFSFNPSFPPGYVWHCHILDHEDNEMMRPMLVKSCPKQRSCNLCQADVEGEIQLYPPALCDVPVLHENKVSASIEEVCSGKVIIKGLIRKNIMYNYISDDGTEKTNVIINDIPFRSILKDKGIKEEDCYKILGTTILCEDYDRLEDYERYHTIGKRVALKFVSKDIIAICVKKE